MEDLLFNGLSSLSVNRPYVEMLPVCSVAAARERGQARDLWATAEELLVEIEAWGDDETDDPLERRLPSQASALHQPQVAYSLPTQLTPLIARETELAELVKLLLNEADVVLVPGTPFGAPGYVRLSFACSIEELEKAVARIKAALV